MSLLRIVLALFLAAAGCAGQRPAGVYRNAVVVTDHALASEAGLAMLRKGGNAVDAAVAVSFCLSVVRPQSCGLGGGGFMVIHLEPRSPLSGLVLGRPERAEPRRTNIDIGGTVLNTVLNYRETAPGAAGPDYFAGGDPSASTRGGRAVAVPGAAHGLLTALEKYGTLSRAKVLAPAIRAAEEGFAADADYVRSARALIAQFEEHPGWKERYSFVWQRFLREGRIAEGDIIRNPEQAAALRLIAKRGRDAFREGPLAEAIVEAVRRAGGEMTLDDLARYEVSEVRPLRFTFEGLTFLTVPPPSSGGVAMAEALGIFEQARRRIPGTYGRGFPAGADDAHAFVESLKHAFADRSRWLGDPKFADVPTERLMSEGYCHERAMTIRPGSTLAPEEYGTPEVPAPLAPADHGTSHISIVDVHGNAVSCTETINLAFGSLVAVEEYGFILNNEMDDFTSEPGRANAFGLVQSARNAPAPGKRPLSSMTPLIAVDGRNRVRLVAGGAGGPRIITATLQSVLSVVLADQSAAGAVGRARLHHQWLPDVLEVEPGWPDERREAGGDGGGWAQDLAARGHETAGPKGDAAVNLVRRREQGRGWEGASDPRRNGAATGY